MRVSQGLSGVRDVNSFLVVYVFAPFVQANNLHLGVGSSVCVVISTAPCPDPVSVLRRKRVVSQLLHPTCRDAGVSRSNNGTAAASRVQCAVVSHLLRHTAFGLD